MLSVIMLSVIMLSVIMLSVIMVSVIMLSVIKLSVIMLSVMLSVAASTKLVCFILENISSPSLSFFTETRWSTQLFTLPVIFD